MKAKKINPIPPEPPQQEIDVTDVLNVAFGFDLLATHAASMAHLLDEMSALVISNPPSAGVEVLRCTRAKEAISHAQELGQQTWRVRGWQEPADVEQLRTPAMAVWKAFSQTVHNLAAYLRDRIRYFEEITTERAWLHQAMADLFRSQEDRAAALAAFELRGVVTEKLATYLRQRSWEYDRRSAEAFALTDLVRGGSTVDHLPPLHQKIWEELDRKCGTQRELANRCESTESAIGVAIRSMRAALGRDAIKTSSPIGYWRPSAPPPEISDITNT